MDFRPSFFPLAVTESFLNSLSKNFLRSTIYTPSDLEPSLLPPWCMEYQHLIDPSIMVISERLSSLAKTRRRYQ